MALEGKKSFLYKDDLKNKEALENKKPSLYSVKSPSAFLSTSPASVKQSFYGPSSFNAVGLSGNMGSLPPVLETVDTSKTVPLVVPIRIDYFDVSVFIHNESTTSDKFNILYSSDSGTTWENFQTSASIPLGADYYGYSYLSVDYANDLWIALQTEDNQDIYFGSGQYTITNDYTSFYGKTAPFKLINATSGSTPGFSNVSAYLGLYLNINVVDSEYVLGPYFESNFQGDSYYDNGYIE
jgi:hypothetical protein